MTYWHDKYGKVTYVREGPPSALGWRGVVVQTKGLGVVLLPFEELTPYVC